MFKHFSLFALGLTCVVLVAAAPLAAAVSDREWASAINVAGRQRMLSQKMMKEFLLAHHGVDAEGQRKQMQSTIRMFADSHRRLRQGDAEQGIPPAPTPEVAAALDAIDAPWAAFSAALPATTNADLSALATANETLLKAVAAMVEVYEQAQKSAMGTANGKVINWAGRQRMLSQRMAKEALLIAAGADREAAAGRLQAARQLFGSSHLALSRGDAGAGIPAPADPAVQKQFEKVGVLWTSYQALLDRVVAGDLAARRDLADASVQILAETNRATSLLEQRVH